MKKSTLVLLILLSALLAAGVACGGGTADTPSTDTSTIAVAPADVPAEIALVAEALEVEAEPAKPATPGCEDYLRFCVTAVTTGTVPAEATTGTNHYQVSDCTAWAAPGAARIVELPFITAVGDKQMTVALTRISAYTGPGSYDLTAVVTNGMPDVFPTIEVDGRAFSNGEGSTAVVTLAADGSGSVQASNLVEIASLLVSNPDPDARLDFSMSWTCKDIE
ncbi:MAG: hypothetical protein HND44_02100 [Chloroflexi bacterium]|nr:hypothetical protein [Ardenticatenaceae bacterium]MBL1127291.1 hypothetical protein [Chloroflexota bacterium]NOG33352.1 hypothetical protein [Chloroflexota bacterium]GIK56176.1 MAG: hypothetical protein BroJett015_18390 [Chloroflexota bacterium]